MHGSKCIILRAIFSARVCVCVRVCFFQKIKVELEDDGIPGTALREISLLKELKHPSIVELKVTRRPDPMCCTCEYRWSSEGCLVVQIAYKLCIIPGRAGLIP